jgi:hypothetical protein
MVHSAGLPTEEWLERPSRVTGVIRVGAETTAVSAPPTIETRIVSEEVSALAVGANSAIKPTATTRLARAMRPLSVAPKRCARVAGWCAGETPVTLVEPATKIPQDLSPMSAN